MAGRSNNPNRSKRRRLLTAGAFAWIGAPALLSACATRYENRIATPGGIIPAPQVKSGELWRYALINRYNGETINEVRAQVASVQPELRVELSDRSGRRLADEIYDAAWTIRQEPIYNETLVFDRPVPLLPPRLAVGSQQVTRTRYRLSGTGQPHSWHVHMHAKHWERIAVPAGTFDALRIERLIRFEHHDLFRRGSRRMDTLWYAPQVNRWVMREWSGIYLEDGANPFGFGFGLSRRNAHGHISAAAVRAGFGPGFFEEGEDAIRWVLLEHRSAPIA